MAKEAALLEDKTLSDLVGLAIGGSSGGAVISAMLRVWWNTHRKEMAELKTSVSALQKELKEEVDSLRESIEQKIASQGLELETMVKEQAHEVGQRLREQSGELKHHDKHLGALETRLAICEDRAMVAKTLSAEVTNLRDLVISNNTKQTARMDAAFEILKGKRQMWDKAGGDGGCDGQ